MRNIKIEPGQYCHVFNRGVNKQVVFHDSRDYFRFLFLILYFQSPITFAQVGREVGKFVKHRVLDIANDIAKERTVELISFCIMPNHFHLILKELEEGAVAAYMQRVLNAYSKYYNTKYEKSGHVFQGPYKFVLMLSDNQLSYLSTYIHRNCRELRRWYGKEKEYPWSSYQDYVTENRWGNLLAPTIILGRSRNKKDYEEFVRNSPAKLLERDLDYLSEF